MQIKELLLRHFGKFTDKPVRFSEGINLIYGENESGKSTIHTFLKAMFFGMERKRGRAAATDTFTQYEPWDNPNYYAGTLKFMCGDRTFCLNRQFDKYAKSASLFCEDDGEELSLEHGDLEVLLGGLTESDYDNTVSIGQLNAAADSSLAAQLRNYAANYYATGNSEIDLEGAIAALKERRKEIDKEEREAQREAQIKRDKIQLEASYVLRDLQHMEGEKEQAEALWDKAGKELERQKAKAAIQKENSDSGDRFSGWRVHPVETFSMIGSIILSFILFERPWNFLVAVVVALAEGIYVWNRLKDGRKKKQKTDEEEDDKTEKVLEMKWKLEKLNEDYREKRIQYENLCEQSEEAEEIGEDAKERERQRRAVELAMERMLYLSGKMQTGMSRKLNERVSEILSEVTNGKYMLARADENLHISLVSEGRNIGMEQVSRGTLEQIYFALRMAAAEVLYDEELPVILDDTFAYYDDMRLEATLRWLERNRQQVLIFTCQKREEDVLKKNGMRFSKVEI